MPYATKVQSGTPVEITTTFYSTDTGAAGDPATVKFSFSTEGSAITVYTYGTDAQIVKLATGQYRVTVPTLDMAAPGDNVDLFGQWDTEGGITVSESVVVLVTGPAITSPFA